MDAAAVEIRNSMRPWDRRTGPGTDSGAGHNITRLLTDSLWPPCPAGAIPARILSPALASSRGGGGVFGGSIATRVAPRGRMGRPLIKSELAGFNDAGASTPVPGQSFGEALYNPDGNRVTKRAQASTRRGVDDRDSNATPGSSGSPSLCPGASGLQPGLAFFNQPPARRRCAGDRRR